MAGSRADAVDRFALAVEQLQVCRELLLSGSAAKARMAVILLDGLADSFLYRRLERLYDLSQESLLRNRTYPKDIRRQARSDFATRVKLCSETNYDSFISGGGGPLVTPSDAVILLVGHSYRNAAYHRDKHNPATIGTVGRTFFRSVAELFTRSHWLGHSSSLSADEAERLRSLGVLLPEGESIEWRGAAASVSATLARELEVTHDDLVEALVADLEERAEAVDELAREIPGEPDDIDGFMASLEFRDVHGSDAELLELRDLRDPVRRAVLKKVPLSDAMVEEGKAAAVRYDERLRELAKGWRPRATLRTLKDVAAVAKVLSEERDPLVVLTKYQGVDLKLDVLEDYLAAAVGEYDRYIDMQIEAMEDR